MCNVDSFYVAWHRTIPYKVWLFTVNICLEFIIIVKHVIIKPLPAVLELLNIIEHLDWGGILNIRLQDKFELLVYNC